MRKWLTIAGGGLMVAACGGGGSESGSVAVVSGTPAPTPTPTPTPTATPTPTPTPTATPTPTPTPTSSYTRYVNLTGNQNFQTACASVLLGGSPPTPSPALAFGDGLTLGYTASAGSYAIAGDGVALTFAASNAVASPAGQHVYEQTVSGSVQRFTITDSAAAGTTLDYTRSFALRTDRSQGSTLYSCVFGVPTTLADRPTVSASYSKVGVTGTAYVLDQSGNTQTYTLAAGTSTVSYDAGANALVVSVQLLGYLQSGGSTATTATDLGTFTGTGAVDATLGKFSGSLDSSNRISLFSSFGGWFFGNTETASAFEILAADSNTGNRMSVVGTVVDQR